MNFILGREIHGIVKLSNEHRDVYIHTYDYGSFLDKLFNDLFDIDIIKTRDLLLRFLETMRELGHYNPRLAFRTFQLGILHGLPNVVESVIVECDDIDESPPSICLDKLNSDDIRNGIHYLMEGLKSSRIYLGQQYINSSGVRLRDRYIKVGDILVNKLISLGRVSDEDWLDILKLGVMIYDTNILKLALEKHRYSSEEIYKAYEELFINITINVSPIFSHLLIWIPLLYRLTAQERFRSRNQK